MRRAFVIKDSLANIARAQSRLTAPLSVRFFAESAVDDGGPTRELASLLIKDLAESGFLQGNKELKIG